MYALTGETVDVMRFESDTKSDWCYAGRETSERTRAGPVQLKADSSDFHMTNPNRGSSDDDGDNDSGTVVVTKTKPKVKKPSLYRVLLLNDDFTPMEFVVHVLQRFFSKNQEEATRIMLHVHQNGVGECGVFTFEVAETKVTQVMDLAAKHQHPLQCVMEKK